MKDIWALIRKELTSKTNWQVVAAILIFLLKDTGMLGDTDTSNAVSLGAGAQAVLAVVIRIAKTLYYKNKKEDTETADDE